MLNVQLTLFLVTARASVLWRTGRLASLPSARTVRDRIWIWGHPARVHNDSFLANLSRKSTIEPVAAAEYMGIRNMLFVRYEGEPAPPFDSYYTPFRKLDRVLWSLVGASGATSADEREQVYQLAEKNENIAGFILDDFFHSNVTGPGADPETEPDNLPPFEALAHTTRVARPGPAEGARQEAPDHGRGLHRPDFPPRESAHCRG